jgi:uncharacterized protein YbjT (DUF2867 family)
VRVILFGATGMVGAGVLIECLADPSVTSVLSISRRATGSAHPKLRELIRSDFFSFEDVAGELAGYDACFFCLGVSSIGMAEEQYHRLTYDITVAAAEVLARRNPGMKFCFVSGENTDSSERGPRMWARVKGKTENRLLAMPLDAFMFRPGYIHPMKGVRSPIASYRAFHAVAVPLYPLLRHVMAKHMTTTENVGRAMIHVARSGYPKRHLENPDIDRAAVGPA